MIPQRKRLSSSPCDGSPAESEAVLHPIDVIPIVAEAYRTQPEAITKEGGRTPALSEARHLIEVRFEESPALRELANNLYRKFTLTTSPIQHQEDATEATSCASCSPG